MINVTPATHRVMTKVVEEVEGQEEIKSIDDETIVFTRPKYFVGGSATVWASEFMWLHSEDFDLFEVKKLALKKSKYFKKITVTVKDRLFQYIDQTDQLDIRKIDFSVSKCPFKEYEIHRLISLKNAISRLGNNFEIEKENIVESELQQLSSLFFELNLTLDLITCLINVLCANESKNETLKCFEALLGQLTKTYDGVKHITPISKSRFVELTDGGPGVGISNKDVQMRIAQRARILDADYLVRHHLANNDSSQNDVERCQGYVGDAICDGGSLLWEYRKPFDGLSDEEIEKMTVQELEEHELQRMEFNTYKVCEELTMKINGARAPGGYMKCYTSQKLDDMFFNDQLYLSKYLSATETKRQTLPGANNYKKIEEFLRRHCEKGQKYIEYLKFSCLTTAGSQCDYCSKHSWVGPPCKRIPRPYPDHGKLPEYKYMHVSRTPIELKGHSRKVDDFQPRVKIKEAVDNGTLSLDSQENLSEFCNEFIVEKKLVIECVENMNVKEINKQKRKEERKQISEKEDMMNFKDFNWKELVETDKLQKLKVSTLKVSTLNVVKIILETLCINWERQYANRELLDALRRTVCGITKCNVIEMTICLHTVNDVSRIKIKCVFGMITSY